MNLGINKGLPAVGYHIRIEHNKLSSLLTTRTRNSELWFINNKFLEEAILGFAARYRERYGVKLYALAIEGNHIHGAALFPKKNRADFMRDFNSSVARAVPRHECRYPGGRLWARRYSSEILPGREDIENWFFYTVLQPVQDGLVPKISEYPGYNCFKDAIYGNKRKFKVVRWAEYNAARRHGAEVNIKDYTEIVMLEYERLPGYENLSQKEYASLMMKKLEERRVEIVNARAAKGLGFVGRDALLKAKAGSLPQHTKISTATDHRPRVLSVCNKRRAKWKAWYFDRYFDYKEASKRYRAGQLDVKFPDGTYRPYCAYRPSS
jgi:hypothetical protein